MNETKKTAVFAVIALVTTGLWYIARPKQVTFKPDAIVGKTLFETFTEPTAAANLRILRWDESLGTLHKFEVAKNSKTGLWTLPSNGGYPADAENQMRDVAVSLVGVKVLGVVSNVPAEHESLGVVEPKEDMEAGKKGVGLLVQFEDEAGKELAAAIIGKEIPKQAGHRFVRLVGQDTVLDVKFDPAKLSTSFADWIEKDFLKLNPIDVERLQLRDYSIVSTTQGPIPEKRFDATTTYNATDAKWDLNEFVTYRRKDGSLTEFDSIPMELSATEELNKEKLNDLKNALDDLKIIDVRRKPKGIGADLTAEEDFLSDQQMLTSLIGLGFYPIRGKESKIELLCANGEVHVRMKDGYEYVLRFGNIANSDQGEKNALNRYLFVTTRVDYSKFPQPELEPLPAGPAPANATPADAKPADGNTGACQDQPATEAATAPAADSAPPSTPAVSAQPNASGSADTPKTEPAAPAKSAEQAALEAEVERITKANQRKLDDWNNQKKKAEDKVRELNGRFADWYYVVAEDVYRKIRISRSDLIKESAKAADEGFGVDAFRKLEGEGIESAPKAPATPAMPQFPGAP